MSTRTARRGFSLIELMMVTAIVSLLAALAQPALNRVLVKARAAEAVSNLNAIKVAVANYHGEFHRYPAEVEPGIIPSGLAEYLPDQFTFEFDGYVLDYDNFMLPDGSPPSSGISLGLTVIPEDEEIGDAMAALIGTKIWVRGDSKFTWIIID